MAQAEEHRGIVLGKGGRSLAIRFAVGLAISVEGGGSVCLVDHRQVQAFIGLLLRRGRREVLGAAEAIAARDPVSRFPFAEHDRIEEIAGPLDAHHAPALLVHIVNLEPDFQGLRFEVDR